MAADSSFDVVSQFDRQELVNAIDQALREVGARYDLKDTGCTIALQKDSVELHSASEFTLNAVRDLLVQRAVKRNLSPKIFDYGKVEEAARGTVRQTAKLRQGIDQDLAHAGAAFAFEQQKPPWRELAVIGNAHAGREDFPQGGGIGPGPGHSLGRARTAAQQQVHGLRRGQIQRFGIVGHAFSYGSVPDETQPRGYWALTLKIVEWNP